MLPDAALPNPAILLQDAGFAVSGRVILHRISADLAERRIGIVGRNGSGKTTLLRLLAGLIAPTSGKVRLAGFDPARDRRAAVAALGILFQNPDHQIIFPTVEQELAFGPRQQGASDAEARAQARATLARHGRSHWAQASVATLSQGQRHYLCLMAVLMMQPATILLDEPFTDLDLPTRARLIRALNALPQRLITITHDPRLLAGYDRVLWLEAGQIRQDGPADAVLTDFVAEMTRIGACDADTDLAL